MNAPTQADTSRIESPVTSAEWRRVALALVTGVLALGLLFNKEIVAAVQTWDASTAYNHCFLIIPIALYLIWDRRFDLVGIPPRPFPLAILLGLPMAAIWLMAERLGIMEGRQLIAVSFVELLFLAVLGKRLWWAMAGPLLYLYFLVPFGEFLTPKLQDVTTWFVRHGLEILGVPAYIDGYIIEIPQGTFFVAEACAGLRFLIASIAFGCLYALVMYRSPVRRGVFILVSIVVPIVANGFRGLGIVYLGYLLGSAEAAATDHILYGWIFFSIVILTLIVLGLPFRQDDISTRAKTPLSGNAPATPVSATRMLIVVAGAILLAAIGPTVAEDLTRTTSVRPFVPASIALGEGCDVRSIGSAIIGATRVQTQRVVCDGVAMNMTWEAFAPRITAAPLMAERRRLVKQADTEGLQQDWLQTGNDTRSTWRIMSSNDPAFIIAVSVWVAGKPARPGLAMRVRMAIDSLFGSAFSPMVMTVTPAVNWDELKPVDRAGVMATLPAFLLRHRDLDQIVAALSTPQVAHVIGSQ